MNDSSSSAKSQWSWQKSGTSGFTLVELLIIISLLSLVLSLGFGSFVKITKREKLRVSLVEANGFIESTRRAAMSHSTRCTISVSATGVLDASEVPLGSTNRCTPPILSGGGSTLNLRDNANDSNLIVETNLVPIGFTQRGTSISDKNVEITLTSSGLEGFSYCLLVSSPLGFTKTGSRTSSSSDCQYARETL